MRPLGQHYVAVWGRSGEIC